MSGTPPILFTLIGGAIATVMGKMIMDKRQANKADRLNAEQGSSLAMDPSAITPQAEPQRRSYTQAASNNQPVPADPKMPPKTPKPSQVDTTPPSPRSGHTPQSSNDDEA